MGKFTTNVFIFIVIANLWLRGHDANVIHGLQGCECNIMDACDANGNPKSNWTQYLPEGIEKFGIGALEYICEGRAVAILYDRHQQIPLYAATVMTGQQLLAGSAGGRPKHFRLSSKLNREYQQKPKDYKGSSQRYLCFQKQVTKKRVVDNKWSAAKSKKDKSGSGKVCLSTDSKAQIHRGHLIASQYGRGDKERMKATFTYSNVVPQFGLFNSDPWQRCESSLVRWGRNYCAMNGTHNVQMFIVVGAIPSTVFGPSETRFFGEGGFSDYKHVNDYPVNMPKYLWTAACCTFEIKSVQHTISTAFYRENDPGNSPCIKTKIPLLTNFLAANIKGNIDLFPLSPQCYNNDNYVPLRC